jgi:hypothetical protein
MDPINGVNKTVLVALLAFMLLVIYVLSSDCNVCNIMQNPPDWIDSWYDGPKKEFFPQGKED